LSAPAAAGSTGSRPIGPDETVSAALASSSVTSSAQPAAITRVPRTEAERQQVLLQRPHYWEFLYFAGQLLHERSTVEAKYRGRMVHSSMENRESAAGGKDGNPIAQFSDFKQLVDYIFQQFSEALDLVRKMSEVINDEAALERAFGARGEEGYPDRLAHLARHWNGTYEALLAWASSLRGANVPPEYQKLLELAARYADEPIQKYRMLIDDYATQVDGMYDAVPMAMATGKPISIEARLSLSSPDKVINDYVAELNSLRSRLHLEGRL